ncbi:hypothetical protein [Streptomyces javensis]|uniref:Uncharacterized protein n=1 Tax=Streptomyces javensis TaxID=114698 RepID=A0ABS0R2Q1_9ACTN|nr:hypothetical protein [Streptomyces javensis]MBI0311642.1 hypothetical protein [Streptomyces javensis]
MAALNAYYRRECDWRIVPCDALSDLTAHHTRRTWGTAVEGGPEERSAWLIDDSTADDPHAQPVTWISHDGLDYQDVAVQEECPDCGRLSRSTTLSWGPGRRVGGPHHICRHCEYRWPAAPVYHVSLWKGPQREYPEGPGACFACHCSDRFRCATDCTGATPNEIVGQLLCTPCRSQFTSDSWRQLVAAGYGTPNHHPYFAEQRDLWLVLRTRAGTAPGDAARAWEQRLALAARRAR